MAYKKLEMGDAHNFEMNAELEGELMGVQEDVGPNHSKLYSIKELTTGEMVSVWGATALDTKMALVEVGQRIRIQYLGKKESQKRKGSVYKDFQVDIWEEEI